MATDKLVDFDHVTDYISREAASDLLAMALIDDWEPEYAQDRLSEIPAANVVQEENILKFYYVRSIDEYWIGRRLDTLYYARYEAENQQWVWTHSRYLPWGEHVVSPTSLWKEHTYPSEPEEIPFTDWLQGFVKKHIAADVRPVVKGTWEIADSYAGPGLMNLRCSVCGGFGGTWKDNTLPSMLYKFCPNCGADMREPNLDTTKGGSHD